MLYQQVLTAEAERRLREKKRARKAKRGCCEAEKIGEQREKEMKEMKVMMIDSRCITSIRETYERRVTESIEFVRSFAPDFPAEGTRERAILDQHTEVAFESMKNETAAYVVLEMKAQGSSAEVAEKLGEKLKRYAFRAQFFFEVNRAK